MPSDNRVWEVLWFGEIKPSIGVSTELTVDVLLRAMPDAASSSTAVTSDFQIYRAGIGELPSFKIGQRWRNGELVDTAELVLFDAILDFSPDNCRIIEAGEQLPQEAKEDSSTRYLIPPQVHEITGFMMPSKCLAIGDLGSPDTVIVPCVEIARAWYLRSTNLALRLTWGPFPEAKKLLFNETYPPIRPDGSWQVVLRSGMSTTDALVAAMLACDGLAQRHAALMMDSIARAAADGRPQRFMDALPPLRGKHRVKAYGTWFPSGGERRFLVSFLEAVPYPATKAVLHWDLDNTNRSEPGGAAIERAAWPKKRYPGRVSATHGLRHRREPNSELSPIHELGDPPAFIGAPRLERLPPRKRTSQSTGSNALAGIPTGELSTGVGEHAPDGPGALRIQDKQQVEAEEKPKKKRKIVAAGFPTLLAIMRELNNHPSLRCRVVAGSPETVGSHPELRSLFPVYNNQLPLKWSLIGDRPRQFLAIEIQDAGRFAYAIEIERSPPLEPGGKSSDSFTLAVMARPDGRQFSLSDFHSVAQRCVLKEGVWPEEINDITVKKLRHAYRDNLRFATAVADAVHELFDANDEPKYDNEKIAEHH